MHRMLNLSDLIPVQLILWTPDVKKTLPSVKIFLSFKKGSQDVFKIVLWLLVASLRKAGMKLIPLPQKVFLILAEPMRILNSATGSAETYPCACTRLIWNQQSCLHEPEFSHMDLTAKLGLNCHFLFLNKGRNNESLLLNRPTRFYWWLQITITLMAFLIQKRINV